MGLGLCIPTSTSHWKQVAVGEGKWPWVRRRSLSSHRGPQLTATWGVLMGSWAVHPTSTTGPGCPSGCPEGLGGTGEFIICGGDFDGWWVMGGYKWTNCSPLLSSMDCSKMQFTRPSCRLHLLQKCGKLSNMPPCMCSPSFSTSFPSFPSHLFPWESTLPVNASMVAVTDNFICN